MKNFISSMLLLIFMCSTAIVEASSPPNQIVAVSDHQVFTQQQQEVLNPVVFEYNAFELPVIPYLTRESAVMYNISKAVLNDMSHYYTELDNSTKAKYKELPPDRQIKFDVITIRKEFNEEIALVKSRAKEVTFRIRQL